MTNDLLQALKRMDQVFSKDLPISVEELCAKHPKLASKAAEALDEFITKMEILRDEVINVQARQS